MSRCGFGAGVTGSAVGRCYETAAPGSLFCGPHRALAIKRVRPLPDQAALWASLRWPVPKRFKVRQVL